MKRFYIFILFFCAFIFTSCQDISSSANSSADSSSDTSGLSSASAASTATASVCETWDYDESFPIYEISSDVSSVTVSGDLGGKTVYLVKANKTSSSISSSDARTITKISNISCSSNFSESQTDSSIISSFSFEAETENEESHLSFKNFILNIIAKFLLLWQNIFDSL